MKGEIRTKLTAFYGSVTSQVDEGRAVDAVQLDFSKDSDTMIHDFLTGKFKKCGAVGLD